MLIVGRVVIWLFGIPSVVNQQQAPGLVEDGR